MWPWQFSRIEGSPWNDIRVRKAANLCVDRNAMKDGLLGGLMVPATGTFEPGHPWRGNPKFQIKFDPNEARKLMTEAGFSKDKKLKVKTQTSASGSGQMLPMPMNEFVQQSLAECFFEVELDVIEWNTLFTNWRKGAKDEVGPRRARHQRDLRGHGPVLRHDPLPQLEDGAAGLEQLGLHQRSGIRPAGRGRRDRLRSGRARQGARRLHERSVDEAAFLWVAHDVGPRAMSPEDQGLRAAEELVRRLLDHDASTEAAVIPVAPGVPDRSVKCEVDISDFDASRSDSETFGVWSGARLRSRPGMTSNLSLMLAYVVKRLVLVVPVVFAVALVCFLLVHIAPGDPLVSVLPPDASANSPSR